METLWTPLFATPVLACFPGMFWKPLFATPVLACVCNACPGMLVWLTSMSPERLSLRHWALTPRSRLPPLVQNYRLTRRTTVRSLFAAAIPGVAASGRGAIRRFERVFPRRGFPVRVRA